MAKDTDNCYEILGVAQDATVEEIRARFRLLARQYHPDRAQHKDTAHQIFVQINTAYQTLIDTDRRALYDRRLAAGVAAPSNGPVVAAKPPPEFLTLDQVKELAHQANDAYCRRDLDEAHAICKRLIKAEAATADIYILIGDVYVGLRQKPKAVLAYREALRLEPGNKMLAAKLRSVEAGGRERTSPPVSPPRPEQRPKAAPAPAPKPAPSSQPKPTPAAAPAAGLKSGELQNLVRQAREAYDRGDFDAAH